MSGRTYNLPTPNLGLNYVDSISSMDPRYCLQCVNFFPTPNTLQLRSGFDIYKDFGTISYSVGTLIAYNEINGDIILFAVVKDNINPTQFYIVDNSSRTDKTTLPNFPVNSNYLKYIVSNSILGGTNLVLGCYTFLASLDNNTDYNPVYLQNNHWGVYHVIPTKLDNTSGQTTLNPLAIPATYVRNHDGTITITITFDTNVLKTFFAYSTVGQVYNIPNLDGTSFTARTIVSTISDTNIILTCNVIVGTLPNVIPATVNIIMERFVMFDTAELANFKPISITQVAGYTVFVMKDTFIMYLIPGTALSAYNANYKYSTGPTVGFNAPIIINFSFNVKLGGSVVDIDSWTVDSGSGQQDYLAIFISTGEIVVFNMSTATPTFSASYKAGDIFAPNCTTKVKGDLVFLSNQGLESMNNLVGSTRVDTKPSLSYNISYGLSQDINNYRNNIGWDIVYHQPTNMLLINVPTSSTTAFQYVMNTTTGAWCKFTNINSLCFGQTGKNLFFGNDLIYILFNDITGNKITYDTDRLEQDVHRTYAESVWDETNWNESVWGFDNVYGYKTTIGGLDSAYFVQAFTTFNISNRKKINLIKPNIYNYSLVYNFEMGLGSDYVLGSYTPYDASLVNPRVAFLTPPVFVSNDPTDNLECRFDEGYTFGGEQISIVNAWFNLPAFGFAVSFQFKVGAYLNDFEYTSTDIVYENSRNII